MASPRPNRPPPRISAQTGPGAIDLLEEAVHRLRLAPLGTLAIYCVGSLPFILGLLYFWADLSSDPDAPHHATGAAFGLTLLFIWMKIFHAIFASELRARFVRRPPAPWTFARLARLALVQMTLQSTALFALPFAALLTVPLGWVYAFYQNVTAFGDGETGSVKAVFARSARSAVLWPKQNHFALAALSLLGLFAWMNLMIAVFILPQLLRQFTGEENMFTRSGSHLANTTFFAVTFSLVFLALDPLIKTFYALRCFYGESLRSGEDLKSDLRALPAIGQEEDAVVEMPGNSGAVGNSVPAMAPLALALFLVGASAISSVAATPPSSPMKPAPAQSVSPPALRQSTEEVLKRREFTWRQPRKLSEAPPSGPGFLDDVKFWLREKWDGAQDWLKRFFRSRFNPKFSPTGITASGISALRTLIYVLIGLIVAAILFLVWKSWRQRRSRRELTGHIEPASILPDLADDEILASQLPEEEWLQLARQLLEKGDRRFALRAFYLSILASLGARGLLAIARHKSNRDYLIELRRRARGLNEVPSAFERNVRRFESVWYGPHPANEELFNQFQADREAILTAIASAAPVPLLPTAVPL
jgi:hypothetical protein